MENSTHCDHYASYKGPDLVSILVDNIENKELYNKIIVLYGEKKNWNGKLYKSKIVFDNTFKNKTITFNYLPTKNGIENWTKYTYKHGEEYLNPPLWTPMSILKSQLSKY